MQLGTQQAEFRTWTSSTGGSTTEAAFLDFREGKVRLKKRNESILSVPIEKLSQADQNWVNARVAAGASPDTGPASAKEATAEDKPVIGIQECSLFAAEELKEETATLRAGAEVSVEEERAWAVRVATAEGKKGWVRRCCLCAPAEFNRRKTAGDIPQA